MVKKKLLKSQIHESCNNIQTVCFENSIYKCIRVFESTRFRFELETEFKHSAELIHTLSDGIRFVSRLLD